MTSLSGLSSLPWLTESRAPTYEGTGLSDVVSCSIRSCSVLIIHVAEETIAESPGASQDEARQRAAA